MLCDVGEAKVSYFRNRTNKPVSASSTHTAMIAAFKGGFTGIVAILVPNVPLEVSYTSVESQRSLT